MEKQQKRKIMGIRDGAHAMQNILNMCEKPQRRLGIKKTPPASAPAA
jgi:hypothetical protein